MDRLDGTPDDFPGHLKTYDSLVQHFRGQLESLSTTAKGDRFAHFVQKLIPQTEAGSDFDYPELQEKKSGDEGIDLHAQGKDGRSFLYIQARLWIDRAEAIDSILSKFQAYMRTHHSRIITDSQFELQFNSEDEQQNFLVVTLSHLKSILNKYENSELATKEGCGSFGTRES